MDMFAPVLSLIPVESDEDALDKASHCDFGLGVSIFTKDLAAAARMAKIVSAGVVSVNDLIVPSADPRVPFGGTGRSGFGSTRGAEGLLELTRAKVVQTRTEGRLQHFSPKPPNPELVSFLLRTVYGNGLSGRLHAILSSINLGLGALRRQFKGKGR
jgi:delta 1-pyrroline-5-carboxylate dehydrogenase